MNLSTETDQRFEGALGGSEYALLKLAMPHYDDVEAEIGAALRGYCQNSDARIVNVLEIGPGSGITTRIILDTDPRIHITAVDSSKKMLADLEEELKKWGQDQRVTLVEAEIGSYLRTVQEGTYDAVASGFVLHNLERRHRSRVIHEIFRVLRPSGLFVNADKIADDDMDKRAEAYVIQIGMLDEIEKAGRPDVKAEWVEHYKVDEQPHIVWIENEAKDLFDRTGFSRVQTVYRHLMEAVITGTKPEASGR